MHVCVRARVRSYLVCGRAEFAPCARVFARLCACVRSYLVCGRAEFPPCVRVCAHMRVCALVFMCVAAPTLRACVLVCARVYTFVFVCVSEICEFAPCAAAAAASVTVEGQALSP